MHYGIGPEVYAQYQRNEIAKAAPLRRRAGTAGVEERGVDAHRRLRDLRIWMGAMLIDAGKRLAENVSIGDHDSRLTT